MAEFTLYNYFRSSTSYRVRIALELKEITYDYKAIHLLNGDQNQAEYRSLNPMGGVPTLVHKTQDAEFVLGQSMAIIEYIDECKKNINPLFSNDLKTKFLIKQFCEIINADVHSYGNLKTLQYLTKNFNSTEEQKNLWIKNWFDSGLVACEKFISSHTGLYCFGDNITAADTLLIPALVTAQRFGMQIENYNKLFKIYNQALSQNAFKKAHPFRQVDTPTELKIN